MIITFIKIVLFSFILTVVIFFINYSFFWDIEKYVAEERFTEKEIWIKVSSEIKENRKVNTLTDIQKEKLNNFYKQREESIYTFIYKPKIFQLEMLDFQKKIEKILETNIFKNKIDRLKIYLVRDKPNRRGLMKNQSVRLFWINQSNYTEFLSVFIHEFAHYVDIYFLEKRAFSDISSKFYQISWESTKVKKIGQDVGDFVSWYSMTNKYEDFAEAYTYYVLHNKDFLERTKDSEILKKKYDFFSNYIFTNNQFFRTKFNRETKIKDYYWDITKIPFEKKKFFNYLANLN